MTIEDYLELNDKELLEMIKKPSIVVEQSLKALPTLEYDSELFKYFSNQEELEKLISDLGGIVNDEKLTFIPNDECLQQIKQYNEQLSVLDIKKDQKYTEDVVVPLDSLDDGELYTLEFTLLNNVELLDFEAKNNLSVEQISSTKYQVKLTNEIKQIIIPVQYSYTNFKQQQYDLVSLYLKKPEVTEKVADDYITRTNSGGEIHHQEVNLNLGTKEIENQKTLEDFKQITNVEKDFDNFSQKITDEYMNAYKIVTQFQQSRSTLNKILSLPLKTEDIQILTEFVTKNLQEVVTKIDKLSQEKKIKKILVNPFRNSIIRQRMLVNHLSTKRDMSYKSNIRRLKRNLKRKQIRCLILSKQLHLGFNIKILDISLLIST